MIPTNSADMRDPIENPNSLYTIGTAIAINSFEKNYINYPYGVLLINISTLLRNAGIDKETKASDLVAKFTEELPMLLNEVSTIMNLATTARKPTICLYAVDYNSCVPKELLREPIHSRTVLHDATQNIILNSRRLFGEKGTGMINDLPIRFKAIQNVKSVYATIATWVLKETHHRDVILFTHYPIDYHIVYQFPKTVLLESHTGVFRKPHQFAVKVFGEKYSDIPFYPCTHTCLGDSKLIQPALGIKQKRELLELAEKENWKTKSMLYVEKSIKHEFDIKQFV